MFFLEERRKHFGETSSYSARWAEKIEKIDPNISEKELARIEKGLMAVEMRTAGVPMSKIKKAIMYKGTMAQMQTLMMNALEKYAARTLKDLRNEVYSRYELLWAGVSAKALTGDLKAIDSACKILKEIRDLMGIDTPKHLSVTNVENPQQFFVLSLGNTVVESIDTSAESTQDIETIEVMNDESEAD